MARRDRLIANAKQYLEPDEHVELVASGQTGAPPGFLGGIAGALGKAKPRHVAVTQRSIYLLKGSIWSTTKLTGVLARHPLGSVAVSRRGRSLTIGEETVWLPLMAEDADAIAERAGSGSGE